MSQDEQFFQAVLDHPEDNALRLIYADWLEERGDPRGELIRVQVELAQTPHADLHWRALKNRETELLDEYLTEWMGPSARRVWKDFAEAQYQPFFAGRGSCRLHRGFRETARMQAKRFLQHAGEIFQTLPLRELHLFLDGNEGFRSGFDPKQLAACEELSKIRHWILEFPQYFRHPEPQLRQSFTALFDAAPIQDLSAVRFRYQFETQEIVRPLVKSPRLENLRTLELRMFLGATDFNDPSPGRVPPRRDGVQTLARAKNLPNLREVIIADHRLTDSMVQLLLNARWFEQLTLLDLSGNALSDESYRQIAALPGCGRLQTLRLSRRSFQSDSAHLQAGGCAALAQADFSHLRELELRHQNIGSGKLRTLLRSQTLGQLRALDLSGNPLKDAGAQLLAQSDLLANLRVLKLEACQLTDEGLAALAHSPHWDRLEQLFIGGNTFQVPGLEILLNSPLAEHLRTLSLAGCGDLGERAFTLFAKSPAMQGLAELDLTGQNLTAQRVRKFVDSPHLHDLAHLSWFQTRKALHRQEMESPLHDRFPGRVRL